MAMRGIPLCWLFAVAAYALQLNITALSHRDGLATLECWKLDEELEFSDATKGSTAGLGGVTDVSYVVTAPGTDTGLHAPPANQWVFILSGLVYVSVPSNSSNGVYLSGGEAGILFGGDTADLVEDGHRSVYPGWSETIEVAVPTVNNTVPAHEVLFDGPCTASEVAGLRNYRGED